MTRPGWWPAGWPWPGSGPTSGAGRLPDGAPEGRERPPEATFLATLLEAFGAERAALYRLDRSEEAWTEERAVAGPEARPGGGRLSAPGHPFTWCLREDLVVQVPAGDVDADRSAEGWALAGPVPGSSRVLALHFRGAPPARARRALRPALDHLGGVGDGAAPRGG